VSSLVVPSQCAAAVTGLIIKLAIKHIASPGTRPQAHFTITIARQSSPFQSPAFTVYDPKMNWLKKHILSGVMLTIVVCTFITLSFAVHAEPLTNAKIMRNFNIIAFGNEYTQRRYDHVRKWAGPIRMGIQGKYPAHFEAFISQHLRMLWDLTKFPLELRYSLNMQKLDLLARDFDPAKINVILFYLPVNEIPKAVAKYFDNDEAQVRHMIKVSTCFAKYGTKNNEIKWAIVVFPNHHKKEHMRACVVEELTQILGLVNDSSKVNPSIFNDTSQHLALTEHDKWMLRMFYDPRIIAGMTRQDAMKAGWEILNEIRPGK
jgi:hypothetical protein